MVSCFVSGAGWPRLVARPSARSRPPATCARASLEFDAVRDVEVVNAVSGKATAVGELWNVAGRQKAAVVFLTHFGDFSSWEIAQELKAPGRMDMLAQSDVQLVCIGLGDVDNAREYCSLLSMDDALVFADEDGLCHQKLQLAGGFLPAAKINPYVKLLPMLMGIGSPGTVQEVARGYFGDRVAKPIFPSPSMFDVLGTGYQRPMELATLRLSNMRTILQNWGKLEPKNTEMLTRQGGAIVFEGDDVLFKHVDRGILTYVDVGEMLAACVEGEEAAARPEALFGP